MTLAAQIATDDQLELRVSLQPAFAAPQQLLHFVFADPVVLLIVEYRNEHIEVAQ